LGTLTRTVEDARMLDDVLKGPDARDRRSLFAAATTWARMPVRVAYIPRFGEAPVDPEIAAAVADFALALGREGCEVREQSVFFDLADAARVWHVLSRSGVAWLMRENASFESAAGASARAMAADGRKLTGVDYLDALEHIAALRRRCAELFAESRDLHRLGQHRRRPRDQSADCGVEVRPSHRRASRRRLRRRRFAAGVRA
jgi:aspartyl-tRNA(Asn)/glutamyl-tRNA(Gln) amidotransferase subunit A